MRTKADYWRFLTTASLIILCVLVVTLFGKKNKAKQLEFDLEEISVFDIDEQIVGRFVRGHVSGCEEQPEADVGTYPTFKSDRPLYGSIWFAGEYGNMNSGIQYRAICVVWNCLWFRVVTKTSNCIYPAVLL